jgi:tetratricopeptide (TPR) repeat protein
MRNAVVIIALLLPLILPAQVHSFIEKYDTDSLLELIPARQGTELANVYNKLATSFSYDDPPLCEKYADLALELSRKLDYKKGMGDAERFSGLMKMYDGSYPEAITHFYNALEHYEQSGNRRDLAILYFDFGYLFYFTRNYQKAEEYGHKSIALLEEKQPGGTTTGTVQDIARVKSAMGLIYRTTGRSDKALEIYRWYAIVMVQQGFEITDRMVHTQLVGRCHNETGNPDSALYYYRKTLDFPEVNSSIKALKMQAVRSMGLIYFGLKNYREAQRCFIQVALEMDKQGYLFHVVRSCIMLGYIYDEEGKPAQAEEYFVKALAATREMLERRSDYRYDSLKYTVAVGAELYIPIPKNDIEEDHWGLYKKILEQLVELCREKGDWRQAFDHLEASYQVKDSLFALQRNRDLIEIQTKFETSRKEQQIEQLSRDNEYKDARLYQSRVYLAGLGAMIIMLILIGILLIRQDKIRAQLRTVILEQKLLRSQMNPHFIFNSMASIQDFIMAKDTRSASNYLSRFAGLIRNILDASLQETIPVEKEIETIGHYLQLQKVRLEEKFDYTIKKDEAIEEKEIRIPALLIQPFVENAIEHGIRHKPGKGHVTVEFIIKNDSLSISIEDDGVGRARAREFEDLKRKNHTSVSTSLIRERLRILNKKSRRKITLEIQDLYDEPGEAAGTRVEIVVPVGS